MAISVRSSSQNSASSGTAITVAAPAGTTTDDVVIVLVHVNTQTTIADNNGATAFTEDLADYQPNTTGGQTVSIFSRRIQAGDPATYAFTAGASNRWSAIAVTFQSPHPTDIYDVVPVDANCGKIDEGGAGATIDSDDITTNYDDSIHVVAAALDDGTASITGWPSGYAVQQTTPAGSQPASVCTKTIATAGATGTGTFTFDTELCGRISLSFAIKSSTGGGGTTYYSTLTGTF
jgi:hypothetical protein